MLAQHVYHDHRVARLSDTQILDLRDRLRQRADRLYFSRSRYAPDYDGYHLYMITSRVYARLDTEWFHRACDAFEAAR